MKRKLGPLQTWQWLAIGAAAGALLYLYRRRQAGHAASASPPQQTATDLGPIDPTTGQPYALEGAASQGALAGGTNQNTGPTNLAQELSDLGAIQGLMAGFTQIQPSTGAGQELTDNGQGVVTDTLGQPTEPATTVNVTIHQAKTAARKGARKAAGAAKKAATHTTVKPRHNPGHTITVHPGGKHTASSSAPHNPRQHVNVAPPAHQMHPPTSHPSGIQYPTPHVPHPPPPRPRPTPRPTPRPPQRRR